MCSRFFTRLTVDHITPTALGGADTPANYQLLCRPCNSKKNATSTAGMQHTIFDVAHKQNMNDSAKTQLLTFRVSPAMKAALQARADVVAGGSMSLVIQQMIAHAMPRWNSKAPEPLETAGRAPNGVHPNGNSHSTTGANRG